MVLGRETQCSDEIYYKPFLQLHCRYKNCCHLLYALTELHSFSQDEYMKEVAYHAYPKFNELIDNLNRTKEKPKTRTHLDRDTIREI